MFRLIAILLTALFAVGYTVPAQAYEAEVGNRAAGFRGFDIVHRQTVDLDDYLGGWVLIDFWATWCGPCMGELPNMLKETRPYVDAGKLSVITVSADNPEQLPDLRRAIRKHHIRYPVIYDGGVYDPERGHSIPAMEWGVDSYPSSFLINPQGVIVANGLRGEKLAPTLEYFLDGDKPLTGLSCYAVVNEDRSVTVLASLRNTSREPMELSLDCWQADWTWDENCIVTNEESGYEQDLGHAVVEFTDFCETVHEFTLPADEKLDYYKCYLYAKVPGTDNIGEGDYAGIELSSGSGHLMLVKRFYHDDETGKFKVEL